MDISYHAPAPVNPPAGPNRHLYLVPPQAPSEIRDETRAVYDAGGPTTPPAAAPARPSHADIAKACGVMEAGFLRIFIERAGPSGSFVATMGTLGEEFGYSDRRVRQVVAKLEKAGFLSRETVTGPGGLACGVRFVVSENLRQSYPETDFTPEIGFSALPENPRKDYPEIGFTPETTPEILAGAPREPGLDPFVSNETHEKENEKTTTSPPTPPPAKKRSLSSSLSTILNGSFPAISADFTVLNNTLSATWLRDVLATASEEVPVLPKERLIEALIAAHNQAEYTFAHPSPTHPINNPMGYVKKLILDEVRGAAE